MSASDRPIPGLPNYTEEVRRTTEEIELKFAGGITDEHVLPVDLYAPSILALGTALTRAHQVLQPGTKPPTVNIRAEEAGSVEALLTVAVDSAFKAGVVGALTGSTAVALLNATALFEKAVKAIRAVKEIGGRLFTKSEPDADGNVTFTYGSGRITLEADVATLVDDAGFRKALLKLFAPLRGDLVSSMELDERSEEPSSGERRVSVDQAEVHSFDYDAEDDDEPKTSASELTLKVVSPVFRRGPAWRFDAGAGVFSAKILDETFMDRVVDHNLRIGANDTLRAIVTTTTYTDRLGQEKQKVEISAVLEVEQQGELGS